MVEPPEKGERVTLNPNLSTRLKPTFFRSGPWARMSVIRIHHRAYHQPRCRLSTIARSPSSRFNGGMPALTRRRDHDRREECWLIYYGDVHVGTIAVRSGIPHDQAPWGWRCGFYPGSEPGEFTSGTGTTFEQARADFEKAWQP